MKTDDNYYPTEALSVEERRLAMALLGEQILPEGSIVVMNPAEAKRIEKTAGAGPFSVVPNPEKEKEKIETELSKVGGRERGAKIAQMFLENPAWADIDTVVIPGCGSSPLGAAAFGESLANMYGRPVAAIVAGQGIFDAYLEAMSGASLMAPMANALNSGNRFIEAAARAFPVAASAAGLYVNDLIGSMHEAATLYALIRARLMEPGKFDKLNMIVSHSKGNWSVLVALLAFELDLIDSARTPEKPIKVVTFGNPQALPDMDKRMKAFFRYFQFFGRDDFLAHNCSARSWTYRFTTADKLDPDDPIFEVGDDPVELMVDGAGHHLSPNEAFKEHHMPMEKILPRIRPTAGI